MKLSALVFLSCLLGPSHPCLCQEMEAPSRLTDQDRANKVQLVYFVPSDRSSRPEYRARIEVVMTFVADLYRRDLRAKGFDTQGFDFEFEKGNVVVHLVHGHEEAAYYPKDHWGLVNREVEAELGSPFESLFVIFCETFDQEPAPYEWNGGVALGARYSAQGGVGMFSAWILQEELCATTIRGQLLFLGDEAPIKGRTALGKGTVDSPRFEFIEDGMGAIAHELGHALGLQHDLRDEKHHVMGNGFRHFRTAFMGDRKLPPAIGFSVDNARLLAHSRFLCPPAQQDDLTAPKVQVQACFGKDGKTIEIKLQASDEEALSSVCIYSSALGSVIGGEGLSGKKETRVIHLPLQENFEKTELQVSVSDVNGNIATDRIELAKD